MKPEDDFEKPMDFADSIIVDDMDMETIPAELMAEFEEMAANHKPKPEVSIDDDFWGATDFGEFT